MYLSWFLPLRAVNPSDKPVKRLSALLSVLHEQHADTVVAQLFEQQRPVFWADGHYCPGWTVFAATEVRVPRSDVVGYQDGRLPTAKVSVCGG